MNRSIALCAALAAPLMFAQPQKPFSASSTSTVSYSIQDGSQTIEITNVAFEVTGPQPLLLRKTTKSKQAIDEIGMQASTTVEAWPVGVDLKQKPLYAISAEGVDPRTRNQEVLLIYRGLEEVEWSTLYSLNNGQKLFDTYVPVLDFSISRDTVTNRYVGLEVPEDSAPEDNAPEDKAKDTRLRAPNVVAVLSYASPDRLIREALITCDDPQRAALLRSFADSTRTLTHTGNTLRISISRNYPASAATVALTIPISKDDLDFAKAVAPAGLHIAAWKR